VLIIAASSDFAAGDTIALGGGTDAVRFTSTVASDDLVLNSHLSAGTLTLEASDASGGLAGTTALQIDAHLVGQALSLFGNAGNDTLIGAAGFSDTITAGAGNDSLIGSTVGNDSLAFGAGADTLQIGGGSYYTGDTIAGSGSLTIEFTSTTATDSLVLNSHLSATAGLTVEASDATGSLAGTTALKIDASLATQALHLLGNAGADTLIGTGTFNDTIVAGAGNNSIVAGSGSDSISVGAGNDTIAINNGATVAGNDSISVGGAGNDTISFNGTVGGTDTVTVGANTTVAYTNAAQSTQSNLSQLLNWSDTNEKLDLSALTTQNTIVDQTGGIPATVNGGVAALQAEFNTLFGSDAANKLDSAVIDFNGTTATYVHLASPTGYSANDLIVELNGNHTLTVSAGVVHH
jgi:Ca2+-binding RTX toxin-like protein